MRVSISVKLFFSYLLVLALSLLPAYWYLRRHLHDQVNQAVEIDLTEHAERVAARLAHFPDDQLDAQVRDVAGILVDRVTVIAPDGRVLGESAVPEARMGQMENHLDRPEVQQALRGGTGTAVRFSATKGESYLYVARALRGPGGAVRCVVRLSRPLGSITSSFHGAMTFLRRTAGAVASVVLLLSLATSLYGVRPLLRLRRAALSYAGGDYSDLPRTGGHDEIGELGQSMALMAHRIQQEMVSHSADHALLEALVRAAPLPALVLGPDLERQEINARFRAATGVDAAHELERLHAICHTPEFTAAQRAATADDDPEALGLPQPLRLRLPWQRRPLNALLCPLPAPRGRVGWALFLPEGEGEGPAPDPLAAARQAALRQLDDLVAALAEGATALTARLCELRAAADAVRDDVTPLPQEVAPVDLGALLARLLREVGPLAEARGAEVHAELPAAPLWVADARGLSERVLRAALVRALQAAPAARPGAAPAALTLRVHEEDTVVKVELGGPLGGVNSADLDQLLGALGGGAGPDEDALGGAEPAPAAPARGTAEDLWLMFRRA